MALAKRQSKGSKVIGIFLGVAIVIGLGYFAYTRWFESDGSETNQNLPGSRGATINFNKNILDDPRLTNTVLYQKTVNQNAQGGQPYPFQ